MAILDEEGLRALLLLALVGDNVAYGAFLRHTVVRLRSFYRRRTADHPEDVEDLVQEAMLAIHNQRHSYRSDQPLTAWIYAIARYKLVDAWRARAVRLAVIEPLGDDSDGGDEMARDDAADGAQFEARRDLAVLIASLPDRFRLPIVHVKIEGRSVAETARLIGMSESAVKVGIHRGLKALAKRVRPAP